jgi:hypothetical protein
MSTLTTSGQIRTLAPSVAAGAAAPSTLVRSAVMAGFAIVAALAAAHFWFNIIRVPIVRPVGPLFGQGPASNEGWAPWYAPLTFAAVLTLSILHLYFRRIHRWTVLGLAGGGLFAVEFGGWAAFWVKNIGYTWYFVPNATIVAILSVQLPMSAVALGHATRVFMQMPLLLAIGAVAGAVVGLVLGLPLRHSAAAAPADAAPKVAAPKVAGWTARISTSVLMGLLGGAVSSLGVWITGIVFGSVVGLIWFFISFRGGRYAFMNVLVGSATIGVVMAVPFAAVMAHPSLEGRFDVKMVALHALARLPVFLLISVGVIKIALRTARKTADVVRS